MLSVKNARTTFIALEICEKGKEMMQGPVSTFSMIYKNH